MRVRLFASVCVLSLCVALPAGAVHAAEQTAPTVSLTVDPAAQSAPAAKAAPAVTPHASAEKIFNARQKGEEAPAAHRLDVAKMDKSAKTAGVLGTIAPAAGGSDVAPPKSEDVPAAAADTAPTAKPVDLLSASSSADLTLPPEGTLVADASAEAPKKVGVESWRARKGESVQAVLKRWSERSGVQLLWSVEDQEDVALKNPVSFVGAYEEAVKVLLKETGQSDLVGDYHPEGVAASDVAADAAAVQPAAGDASAPAAEVSPIRFRALQGADLKGVLESWASDAGVALIWKADRSFALKDSFSQQSTLDTAVAAVLDQFSKEAIRPVGQLNTDPETGDKTLIIQAITEKADAEKAKPKAAPMPEMRG